jgi:hypothetical protein
MTSHTISAMPKGIESAVHRVVSERRRVTFTVLSHEFPQYTWQKLFQVLHFLQEKDLVVLAPLRWDYEIRVRRNIARTDGRVT